mmetsp:Transcript_36505/g.83533  ORF Transcript_36505/g.83533 Transcript_36505/m.83533 type:complete len:335 (-) Transcript_36505:125-1129(-)
MSHGSHDDPWLFLVPSIVCYTAAIIVVALHLHITHRDRQLNKVAQQRRSDSGYPASVIGLALDPGLDLARTSGSSNGRSASAASSEDISSVRRPDAGRVSAGSPGHAVPRPGSEAAVKRPGRAESSSAGAASSRRDVQGPPALSVERGSDHPAPPQCDGRGLSVLDRDLQCDDLEGGLGIEARGEMPVSLGDLTASRGHTGGISVEQDLDSLASGAEHISPVQLGMTFAPGPRGGGLALPNLAEVFRPRSKPGERRGSPGSWSDLANSDEDTPESDGMADSEGASEDSGDDLAPEVAAKSMAERKRKAREMRKRRRARRRGGGEGSGDASPAPR